MKRCLYALIVAAGLSSSGCNLGQLKEAATEPNPQTGKTPVQQLVGSTPDVVANPFNPNAWAEIIEAVILMGAAGFGYKEWRQFRRTRAGTGAK